MAILPRDVTQCWEKNETDTLRPVLSLAFTYPALSVATVKSRMAIRNLISSTNTLLGVVLLIVVSASFASSENTKTVDFNVKPGGVVHTFSEKIVSVLLLLAAVGSTPGTSLTSQSFTHLT